MLAIRTDTKCPTCGEKPFKVKVTQMALLIHGGYGEDRKVTVEVCWCGTRLLSDEATNPRSR